MYRSPKPRIKTYFPPTTEAPTTFVRAPAASLLPLLEMLSAEIASQKATIARLEAELGNAIAEYQRYQQLFKEGISKGGWKQRIILPGMSFEEGFLFFSTKFNFEEFATIPGEEIYPIYSVTRKRNNFVEIEGYAQTIQIQEVDGVVVISLEEYEGC